MKRHLTTALAIASLAILAACAPAASSTIIRPAALPPLHAAEHYHPHEPGTTLTYVSDDGDHYQLHTLAPQLISGEVAQHQHYQGEKQNQHTYRQDTPQGVLLIRTDNNGAITTYDPPILELPAAGRLSVGLRWGGETTARSYPNSTANEPSTTTRIAYLTEVTDSRNIRIGHERVITYLISTEQYHQVGEQTHRVSHQRWYAPYYGDVTNWEGHRLIHVTH